MKKHIFALLCGLAGCAIITAQTIPPANIGPVAFILGGPSSTGPVLALAGQSYCTVTVDSTATMGSATVTLESSADNGSNYFAVTGVPDLGTGGSAAQTITTAGTRLSAPVSGQTNFKIVLTGGTAGTTNVTGKIVCAWGSGALGNTSGSAGGGAGGNATIVSPTNAAGQVVVAIASPVDGSSNVKVAAQNTISPIPAATATAGAAPPATGIPVMALEHCIHQNGLASPAPSAGNIAMLLCDDLDRLMINTSDPGLLYVKSGAIASAVTTLLVAGVNNKRLYIYQSAWESSGTNASNTVQWEYGQGATCATNTTTIFPTAIAPGTASGIWTAAFMSGQASATTNGGMPGLSPIPFPLPLNATGYGWCGVTAGTTTAGNYVTIYAVHDY